MSKAECTKCDICGSLENKMDHFIETIGTEDYDDDSGYEQRKRSRDVNIEFDICRKCKKAIIKITLNGLLDKDINMYKNKSIQNIINYIGELK
jgi:hypothetical protein